MFTRALVLYNEHVKELRVLHVQMNLIILFFLNNHLSKTNQTNKQTTQTNKQNTTKQHYNLI